VFFLNGYDEFVDVGARHYVDYHSENKKGLWGNHKPFILLEPPNGIEPLT